MKVFLSLLCLLVAISLHAGAIALWALKRSLIKVDVLGMKALLEPSVKEIAIANPAHAPCGRAAVAAMQKAKIYDLVKSKPVLGENISQAAKAFHEWLRGAVSRKILEKYGFGNIQASGGVRERWDRKMGSENGIGKWGQTPLVAGVQ